ncbi:MAG: hypothetical protein JRL30_25955 [Deltaproteobacteria bacterium]|nr:hypothetical protein [Deltaproteobacteria bacterium]
MANDVDTLVKRFVGKGLWDGNLTTVARDHRINTLDGSTAYFITDDGSIYSYDGSSLELIFENVEGMIPAEVGFGLIEHNSRLYGPNVVIDQNGNVFPGHFDGTVDNILPVASVKFSSGTDPVLWAGSDASATTKVRLYALDGGTAVSAFIDLSDIDGFIENIDKLLYSVTLSFDKFTTAGQSIEIQYGLNGETPSNSIGTATQSTDGAVSSKELLFGDDIIGKSVRLRAIMVNGTGAVATTPKLRSITVKYLPLPHYRHVFSMTLNCINEILLKDGRSIEQKRGEELRSLIRKAWFSRNIIEFEDFDGETVLLDGNLAIDATTVPVQSTTENHPEQGRIKIEDEEMLYTGKTQESFTGVTRGARGTVATTHTDDDEVRTGYDVIVVDYKEELRVPNKGNVREYYSTVTLLET